MQELLPALFAALTLPAVLLVGFLTMLLLSLHPLVRRFWPRPRLRSAGPALMAPPLREATTRGALKTRLPHARRGAPAGQADRPLTVPGR